MSAPRTKRCTSPLKPTHKLAWKLTGSRYRLARSRLSSVSRRLAKINPSRSLTDRQKIRVKWTEMKQNRRSESLVPRFLGALGKRSWDREPRGCGLLPDNVGLNSSFPRTHRRVCTHTHSTVRLPPAQREMLMESLQYHVISLDGYFGLLYRYAMVI